MQNQFGAIKIGRSAQPEGRKEQVAQQFRCRVKMVAVFPNAGHKEEWCHVSLKEHSLGSEWFAGHDLARAEIAALLEATLVWPYDLDAEGLERWHSRVSDDAADRYWRKRERKMIRWLIGAVQGKTRLRDDLDGDIALLVGYTDLCSGGRGESGFTARWHGRGPEVLVPPFTRKLEAARLLWSVDTSCPEPTTEDPLQYCLEALCEAWGFDAGRLSPLDSR